MKEPIKDVILELNDGSSNGRAAYMISGKGYVVQDK